MLYFLVGRLFHVAGGGHRKICVDHSRAHVTEEQRADCDRTGERKASRMMRRGKRIQKMGWVGMKSIRMAVATGMAGLVSVLLLALALSAYRVAGRPAREGAIAAASSGADKADELMAAIRGEAIRADMRFLADDLLEGRGTGTRGYEIAAKYVAAQFEAIGLQPAGDGGTYFQNVPFKSSRPDGQKTSLALINGGKEDKLEFKKDFITRGDPGRAESSVEADVVFVGDGVTAEEQGYDDYQGVDVKGKVAAFLYGAPPSFETSLRAHYSSLEVKEANAAANGAGGMMLLDDQGLENL